MCNQSEAVEAELVGMDFDFEPARLSAAHLGAGETSETNIKV